MRAHSGSFGNPVLRVLPSTGVASSTALVAAVLAILGVTAGLTLGPTLVAVCRLPVWYLPCRWGRRNVPTILLVVSRLRWILLMLATKRWLVLRMLPTRRTIRGLLRWRKLVHISSGGFTRSYHSVGLVVRGYGDRSSAVDWVAGYCMMQHVDWEGAHMMVYHAAELLVCRMRVYRAGRPTWMSYMQR